jgi:hypothetical protein
MSVSQAEDTVAPHVVPEVLVRTTPLLAYAVAEVQVEPFSRQHLTPVTATLSVAVREIATLVGLAGHAC